MTNKEKTLVLNLQLFADGAEGGDGGTNTGGAENTALAQPNGSNAQIADVQNDAEALAKAFEQDIKGKYKGLFNDRVKGIVNDRLKTSKQTVDSYNKLTPALELLAKRYKCDVTDIEALTAAIETDDSYLEQEAMEKGVTVEQLKKDRAAEKEITRLRAENEAYKQAESEQANREAFEQHMNKRFQESEALKELYPDFDFNREMQNQKFFELVCIPALSVRDIYEIIHRDEIIPSLMEKTAKNVEKKLASNAAVNNARPNENGNAAQSAALSSIDVSKLTPKQIDEINARVMNGEKLSFTK